MNRHRIATVSKTLGIIVLVGGVSIAAVNAPSVLFPDWSGPTSGTYEEPSGELGKKTSTGRPWSVETVASAIDGKPLDAKPVSVVGEIVDLSCYLQVGKHGDKHRGCGQKCVANGQPVGLLEANGTIYMLIDEEHNSRRDGLTEFRKQAIEHMAHIVTVNGSLSEVQGMKAIYVQGYLKAASGN
ncbi:MAG: hypothetical protein MK102_03855 [Fuerstiella sp.]|nr:hypothetical protein [Fuerstiella sp.]